MGSLSGDLGNGARQESAEAGQLNRSPRGQSRSEPLGFVFFGVVVFLLVYFLRPEDWISGLAAFPIAKLTGVIILLALVFAMGQVRWHTPTEILLLVLLLAQLWLSAVLSPVWKGGAIKVMLDFSKVLPLVIAIWGAVRSFARLRVILFVQAASVAAIAMASVIGGHTSLGRLQSALSGVTGDPNDLALLIDLSLPLCLALAITAKSRWGRLVWFLVMVIMAWAVVMTASRAGALSLGVVIVVCLWQLGLRNKRLLPAAISVLLMLALWVYAGNTLRARFGQTLASSSANHGGEASESAEGRKELFFRSLKVTAEHPLFGVGPGNFILVSGLWHVTHNSYTQMSSEGGLPAFALYLLILWRAAANLRVARKLATGDKRATSLSIALTASFAGYLVGSFFLTHAYDLFCYCLVSYTTALLIVVRRVRRPALSAQLARPAPVQAAPVAWY